MHVRVVSVILLALLGGCTVASAPDSGAIPDASEADADRRADLGVPDGGPSDAGGRMPFTPAEPVTLSAPFDPDAVAIGLRARLEAAGFEVSEGRFEFFTIDDCRGLPSCYGNNPTSPYGLYYLPPAPGAAPAGVSEPFFKPGGEAGWRLREDEAIVWIGRTPPRTAYFGFRSYVFSRGATRVFASLGDTLNPLTTRTGVLPPAAAPFDAAAVVVTTADRNLDAQLRMELGALGVPREIVNPDSIPRDVARLGLDADSDVLTMLFRVALFEDSAAGQAWLDDPPARLLRVRPATPRAIDPYLRAPLRPRGTGMTQSRLQSAVAELGRAIQARNPGTDTPLFDFPVDGFECLARDMECLGDNRDTRYIVTVPRLLGPNDVWWIYGVNQARAGKATYMNVSVQDSPTQTGVGSLAGAELEGTIGELLPATHSDRDLLFAVQIRRDCTGIAHCLTVPEAFPGVPLDHTALVNVRPYLERATATAPLTSELILPRLIVSTR